MRKEHLNEIYRASVESVLQEKVEEFAFLGYADVSTDELWGYLTEFKWTKLLETMPLNKVVTDIYSSKVGDYMSYASFVAIKTGVVYDSKSIDLGDLSDLF